MGPRNVSLLLVYIHLSLRLVTADTHTFTDGKTIQICCNGTDLDGIIYSPEYDSAAYTTSDISYIVFCNLPRIHWLHLNYIVKLPASSGCMRENRVNYLLRGASGDLIGTDDAYCDNGAYVWRTILHNEPTVNISLPATVKKATFRMEYKVINCAPPHTTIAPARLPTVRVVGCEEGYSLPGDQPSDNFTCDSETGWSGDESPVPTCLSDSVPATPILPLQTTASELSSMKARSSTTPSSSTTDMTKHPAVALAVALSISGLVILVIIVILLIWLIRRRRHKRGRQLHKHTQNANGHSTTGHHVHTPGNNAHYETVSLEGGPVSVSNNYTNNGYVTTGLYVYNPSDNVYSDTVSLEGADGSVSNTVTGQVASSKDERQRSGGTRQQPSGVVYELAEPIDDDTHTEGQGNADYYTNAAQLRDREIEARESYGNILAVNKSKKETNPNEPIEMIDNDIYGT